jgi:hypothetical protein
MNNSHLIKVKFQGPTNYKGSRVYLSTFDLSHTRHTKRPVGLTLNYDHTFNSSEDIAIDALKKAGLKILGMNERGPESFIMCEWDFDKLAKMFKVKGEK